MTVAQRPGRRIRMADDSGSLTMAILLTTIGMGLVALLSTVVVAQQRTTRIDVGRVDALDAAQTGLGVAVSQFRNTGRADGYPDKTDLQCGGFSGSVGPGSTATYDVTVYYLTTSPPSGDEAWANGHKLTCTGSGPASLPAYALVKSTGTAVAHGASRTVFATYAFQSVMSGNIAGGQIHVYHESGPDLCMAAPRSPVVAGDSLVMKPCATTSSAQTFFSYEASLNLVLVSSRTTAVPGGMCLDASPSAGATVKFQPCAATPTPRQQWGQNDYSAFQGTTDGVNFNQYCFNIVTPGQTDSLVKLGDSNAVSLRCYDDWTPDKTFYPDAPVGTGRAGAATNQLVNFDQLGRCIDVTGDDVTTPYLVVFPCKQKPSGPIQWNQAWVTPAIPRGADGASGRIYTTYNGQTYCLSSPGSTLAGKYVRANTTCPTGSTTPANMTWTVRPYTGVYSTSFRIESTYNAPGGTSYCLTPTDPNAPSPDLWTDYGQDMSKLVVATCNSSKLQKWNVSASLVQSPIRDVVER
jgi:hypothetical protein